MKFFIDTAEINEIKELNSYGLLDGVTTNPSLIAKSGQDLFTLAEEICSIVKGPVSLEVTATEYENMIKEGLRLSSIAENIAVKLPMTMDGLKACRFFADKDIMVNLTLCFSASQAILAAKAGAKFVSPFIGRLDDIGHDGLGLIEEICQIYSNYPNLTTEILVASIRNPTHIIESAKMGADIATIPSKVLLQLIKHPLTDKGLSLFLADWKKTGQKIIP
ncbi:MAG: fructose-6-phosphate aldolase [Rickettsiales bacterium]|jgi:transaldolase|nr:fructose-6-phosphate aldolase [Rickettsiales bacterium]